VNDTAQTIIAATAILAAIAYLILRARKKSTCDKGCGCDAKKPAPRFPK
jgi:hypothetical protein